MEIFVNGDVLKGEKVEVTVNYYVLVDGQSSSVNLTTWIDNDTDSREEIKRRSVVAARKLLAAAIQAHDNEYPSVDSQG